MADNADISVLSLAGNPKPQRSKLTTALGSIKHLTSHVVDAGSVVEGAKVAVKAVVDVTSGAMDVTNKIVGSAIGLSVTADTVGGGAAAEIMHARVVNGPEGLGRCLVATRAVRKGEIVMLEKPLLRGEPHAELPPIAAFAAVPDAAAPMPDDLPELGGDAWPRRSTFDTKVMGLLLAFAEADHATRAIFLAELQHEMERPFGRVGPVRGSAPTPSPWPTAPPHAHPRCRRPHPRIGRGELRAGGGGAAAARRALARRGVGAGGGRRGGGAARQAAAHLLRERDALPRRRRALPDGLQARARVPRRQRALRG